MAARFECKEVKTEVAPGAAVVDLCYEFNYRYAYDYRSRRVVRDESGAGGIKTALSFSGGTSVQEYQIMEIQDPDTDPDGDSQSNFYEFAFGGDPIAGFGGDYWPPYEISSYEEWAAAAISMRSTAAQIVAYRDARRTLNTETIRGSDWGGGVGGILYTITPATNGPVRSYNAYNSRGDVVSTTGDAGTATWQASYEAFGTRTAADGINAARQRANTKEEDPTGLLNEGMRYRDLAAGVFISRDPAGQVDGPNVYTYVKQNPWTAFDPEGLWMQPVGDWLAAKFGAPPTPVAFMARHSDKVTGTVHAINAGVSFVPGLGKLADGLDATISSAEGHYAEAALTAGGGKAAHLASNAMHATAGLLLAAKIASHGEEVANVVKATEKTAEIVTDLSKTARTVAKEGAEAVEKEVTTAANGATHGHHSDPKFMGGDPKQKLTDMPVDQHKQLHKDLNDHLVEQTDDFGNHMRPQRGNSGEKIRKNFTDDQRRDAMAEFYKKNDSKYPDAAKDFFDQHSNKR